VLAVPSNPSTFVDFQENAMGLHLFFADKMEKETQNFPNSAILKDLFWSKHLESIPTVIVLDSKIALIYANQ
jgi:hypothetical protein